MTERLYTQQQIADLLKVSRRAVHKRAVKDDWRIAERRKVRGGEVILHAFSDLPRDIRQRIDRAEKAAAAVVKLRDIEEEHAREMAESGMSLGEQEAEKLRREEQARIDRIMAGRKKFAALPKDDKKRLRAKAREWVVTACGQYRREHDLDQEKGQLEFSLKVGSGEIVIPAWVEPFLPKYNGRRGLSEGTVDRWTRDYLREGRWGLTDGYGHRAGDFKVVRNRELYRLVLGAMVKAPQIKAERIIEFLEAEQPALSKVVSARRLHEFMKWWKAENAQLWTFITNPDKWKNIYMAAAGSVFERIDRLNQLWELDSTPGDWLLKDGRHSVVGAIDLHSRRLKFFVSKTSTAAAVKQLLRRCMLHWGVPEAVRTDNGADYVSEAVDSLLRDLQIMHEVCIPFASEEKGTIERAMRTMSHGLLELLPGFVGHNVAERKAIEARKAFSERVMKRGEVVEVEMTSDELQAKLDEWTEFVYHRNPHGGLNGKTPWEIVNAWREPVRAISDAHALDELLAEMGGTRIIGKKGIRFDNRFFIDPTGMMYRYVGKEVTIRIDEHDIGNLAVYLDGAFLCWATDPDVSGIERKEVTGAIKHSQKNFMAEQAQELKGFTRSLRGKNIVQTVINYRKAQAENIVDLPKRSEQYTTPALEQAGIAAATRKGSSPDRLSEVSEEQRAELARDMAAEHVAPVVELRDTAQQRYARAYELEHRLERSELVQAPDRRWLEGYKQTSEYGAMKDFFEDFGLPPQWRQGK
jgi:hypothetical protein